MTNSIKLSAYFMIVALTPVFVANAQERRLLKDENPAAIEQSHKTLAFLMDGASPVVVAAGVNPTPSSSPNATSAPKSQNKWAKRTQLIGNLVDLRMKQHELLAKSRTSFNKHISADEKSLKLALAGVPIGALGIGLVLGGLFASSAIVAGIGAVILGLSIAMVLVSKKYASESKAHLQEDIEAGDKASSMEKAIEATEKELGDS